MHSPSIGTGEPSADLMTRRRYDDIDRFITFVEQLDVACDLLQAGTLAKTRLALVCVDNLVSLLLHGNAEAVFTSGEGSRWHKRKRYTQKERREILGDFSRMVALATHDTDGPAWRTVRAITSAPDAAIMRVSHRYRNGVYHEDRHNVTLIGPLTKLYAQAFGRAFVRAYSSGWSSSIDSGRAQVLANYGYEPQQDDFVTSARMLDFGVAADVITKRLTGPFDVDKKALGRSLSCDIVERTVGSAQTVLYLLENEMPPERLEWVFYWSQFWAKHGADEVWLSLEDERDALAENLPPVVGGRTPDKDDPVVVAYARASEAHIKRGHELQRQFKPGVGWRDAPRLGKLGERLVDAKDIVSLLSRYEQIDRDVEQFEIATAKAANAWDNMVETEIDRLREGD